ncbi:MAG: hypothetical protein ACI959_001327 [Limisphaerales bacterium]|jgi:hypothetical protein
MRYYLLTILTACLFSQSVNAQSSSSGIRKYSNEFLAIGLGARGMAMAGSNVASVSDITAGYWNPAGLTGIKSNLQVSGMHAEYFAGIAKYDYAAVGMPIKGGDKYLGFSFIRFGVDDIANTLFLFEPDGSINYDNITSFNAADYAFMVSYAQPLGPKGMTVGGTVKVIHRNVGSFANSWGFGLDLGMQYATGNWRFGLVGKDITSTFNAWSFNFTEEEKEVLEQTGNLVPESSYELTAPKFVLGAGYDFGISEKFGLLTELNFDLTTDGRRNVLLSADPVSVDPHMGLELDYNEFIFLRAGVGNIQKATSDDDLTESWLVQPNMGLGLQFRASDLIIHLDYAYTNIGNTEQLLYSHVFSLKLDFNKRSIKKNAQT